MRLYVGCAMWSHQAWAVPKGQKPLRAYAGQCTAVEGNTTFYATPSPATVESWASQTPAGFRFVLKLPKVVTHERRLIGATPDVTAFLRVMAPLEARVHAYWIQLPASFGPDDLPALARFLHELPGGHRYAVEVRHPGFFAEPGPLEEVLHDTGTEWVPFDTTAFFAKPPTSAAEREAWTKKPRVPARSTALTATPIVRYLGRDDTAETVAGWQPWVRRTAAWLHEGREPTVFLHTPDNADAPALARRFHDEVRALVPGLEPLPTPEPVDEPLTLF
ncbi:uncharacterized protein YecE (DUF72 family) [Actinoplanes tereljensis]|uniref:DUF72 domain-containing protein n=1 Tax=Paractinoplanes tereljensis TaxID=571912 RepID=A0A919NNS6_9ACTN|nr:DUF72 domain-containing protein [Actinoplanes tereljensis]GIF22284.1 hypothetical protein Ate02nite_50140 [Actinoplanes tereljensis]